MSISPVRLVLGGLGVLGGLYGAWLLLTREGSTRGLVDTAVWLASGVVLHDFVLAPLVLLLVYLGRRVLPGHAHAAVVGGLVVLGSATLLAVPVLGRFGARADNPTLLDRHYTAGWIVLAALVLVVVVVMVLVERARPRRREPGQ